MDDNFQEFINILEHSIPSAGVLVGLIIFLYLNSQLFKRFKSNGSNRNLIKNSIAFLLIIIGAIAFVVSLNIETTGLRGEIIKFLGIIISAAIALSSTTVLGNLIAGIMNNSMKTFRNGALIKIGDIQGRVIKKNTFHTEIQLEDSNLIAIPNLYIAKNPVKLTRKVDTVVSTSVSLGYDISRTIVEEVLKDAAMSSGLTDPYVYITNLGDFSVVYKIHGFLEDSSKFLSVSSLLNCKVLDKLHEKKIEIVSPNFMNQKRIDAKEFIPTQIPQKKTPDKVDFPEELIFDKAIKSGKIEDKKDFLINNDEELKSLNEKIKELDDNDEIKKIKYLITKRKELKGKIEESIKEQTKEINDSE